MDNKSFAGYISNFDSEVSLTTLEQLQLAVINPFPCLINFFTKDKKDIPSSVSLQEAEKDKGGLGKTVLLERSRNYVYANRFPEKGALEEARKLMPTIELAEQYITKQAILLQIVDRLCKIDSSLLPIFETFTRVVSALSGTHNADYDPSFIAEKLFDEATQPYTESQNTEGGQVNPFAQPNALIIFIDAFDAQYIGAKNAPFRKWLLEALFPYLIRELNITVVVAGRGKVDLDPKFKVINKEFPVKPFNQEDLIEYLVGYPKRIHNKPNPVSDKQKNTWTELTNELRNNQDLLGYIYECTNGKPIFIDYFADLVYQLCIIRTNEYANLTAFVRKIQTHSLESGFSGDSKGEGFRKYIIDGLYYRQQNKNEQQLLETIKTVQVLSLFQHGLNAKDLAELVTKIDGEDNDLLKTEQQVDAFFTFFQSANLSYVKDRKAYSDEYPPSIRLLHDETVFLFRKYYNDYDDPTHNKRDAYIGYMLRMYERKLEEKEQMPVSEYNKKLLEYLEYSFTIYKKSKEQDAINRLLFEFSFYLDRHPDLCSRILEKGLNYYSYKRQLFKDKKETYPDLTLTFSKDFALLVKLKFREVEYCLTERSRANNERIEDIIKKIRLHIEDKDILLTDLQKNSIEARCLVSEGELFFWQGEWDRGRDMVIQAREKFYKTGDSQGVTWAEHLLGFEAQRSGQFSLAVKHHKDAIENALDLSANGKSLVATASFRTKRLCFVVPFAVFIADD